MRILGRILLLTGFLLQPLLISTQASAVEHEPCKPSITSFELDPSTFVDGDRVMFVIWFKCLSGGLKASSVELQTDIPGWWVESNFQTAINRRIERRATGNKAWMPRSVSRETGRFRTRFKLTPSNHGFMPDLDYQYRVRIKNDGRYTDWAVANAYYRH